MAAMIRKKTRAHEAHLKQLEELYTRAQQGPRETERGNSDIFDKFRKLNPTEFQEKSDPAIAEDWINSLEVIFEFMAIEDAEKIRCATFMLKREARKWWETAKQGKDLRTMTWSQFRDLFFEKYFSADVRAHRAYKFYSLRQGDKSVAEYVWRFEQLVGYVPHIAKEPVDKMNAFLRGLNPEMRKDCRVNACTTLQSCIDRALKVEQLNKEIAFHKKKSMFPE